MNTRIIYLVIILFFVTFIAFASENQGFIEGIVVNETKEPIANVSIQLNPGNYFDITDLEGHFILENIPEDVYQIKFEHIAYNPVDLKNIYIKKNQITVLDTIQLKSKIISTDEFIITADRIERDPFETPNAVNVISKVEINDRAAKTSAEALREENGIFVQKTNHGGGSAIIRGLSSNQILILVDGIRLNNSLYRLGNHQYLTTVDNNSIQQIEIVRGPTSMLYGSDAMGGTINLRTKMPEFNTAGRFINLSLLSRYASADNEKTISARGEFSTNKVAFNTGFSYKDYGDLRRGRNSDYKRIEKSTDGIIQSPNGYAAYDFDSKLIYKFSNESDLIAAYQLSNQENVPRYDKYENDNYYLWKYQPQRRQLAYLKYERNFFSNYINSFNTTISYSDQVEGRHTQRRDDSDLQKEKDEAHTFGLTFEANSLFRNHSFLYGAEIYTDKIKSEQYNYDADSGVRTKSPLSRYPDGAEYNSYGFYIQDEYNLSKKLTTIFGGRYSYFNTRFQLVGMDSSFLYNNNPYEQSFKAFTFSLGTVYRMINYLHFYFNLGQAFRAPNLSDISKFGESKGEIFEVPNPDLEPEKMFTIDLGIKINHSIFKVDGSVYYSKISDLLASADAIYKGLPTIEIDSTILKIKSKKNIGEAYIYGAEGSFRYMFLGNWYLRGNFTWIYGKNTTLDEPVGGIPPLFGLTGIQYNKINYKIDFYMRFAAKQDRLSADDLDDPRIPRGGTPPWQTYNIRIKYMVSKLITLQTALENILDYNYREHGSGINGPGRNFIISLNIHI